MPSHRIAILMSAEGRFLECLNCLLRVPFTSGAHYEVIAKQFDSHSCSSPIPLKDDAPRVAGSHLATVGRMRSLVVENDI